MKVIMNLPTNENDKKVLNEKIATFRAKILLENIKKLNYENETKKEILTLTLSKLKENLSSCG